MIPVARFMPSPQVRTIVFYGLSVVLWLSFFYTFFKLRQSSVPLRDRNPDSPPQGSP
jgi:hypothetical protein